MTDDGGRSAQVDRDAAVVGRTGQTALVGQPAEILLGRRRWRGGRERRPEVGRKPGQLDPVLGPSRTCDRRRDARQVELEQLVEDGPVARFAPEALRLRVAFDERDSLLRPTGQAEVGDRLVVDREERRGRPELWAHVADRRPIGQGEGRQPVAGEFHE